MNSLPSQTFNFVPSEPVPEVQPAGSTQLKAEDSTASSNIVHSSSDNELTPDIRDQITILVRDMMRDVVSEKQLRADAWTRKKRSNLFEIINESQTEYKLPASIEKDLFISLGNRQVYVPLGKGKIFVRKIADIYRVIDAFNQFAIQSGFTLPLPDSQLRTFRIVMRHWIFNQSRLQRKQAENLKAGYISKTGGNEERYRIVCVLFRCLAGMPGKNVFATYVPDGKVRPNNAQMFNTVKSFIKKVVSYPSILFDYSLTML